MQTTRDLTQALSTAAIALWRTRDAEEVVRVAIAETQRAAGVEAVSLHLLDSSREVLLLREFAGTTPAFRDQMAVLPLLETHLAEAVIQQRRVVSCAVDQYPAASLRELYAAQGFRHLTAVPVSGRDQVLGLLHLAGRHEPPLTPEEIAMVEAIGGLVGVALENAALQERMAAQQDRLRALASGILQAREEEARRIAHELHDEAGQLLASVHIALDELAGQVPERAATFRDLHGLLDRVEGQLRRLSREIRPSILDDLGLGPALEWLAQGVAERTGLAISVAGPERRLSPAVETALYRVVQEALTNAGRHARARKVGIEIRAEGPTVRATVQDDGQGFDVGAALARRGDRGLGLIGMRERVEALGGALNIVSAPGTGTRLSVSIPAERFP
ncbi:MAG TPA: GAF domain-containing sensor histidine kinase [Candidatus Methylomirabilis sp.]|nr:GAF domain-containing sensor histidine kinase [Candidatus Methylomirabilis sp.]